MSRPIVYKCGGRTWTSHSIPRGAVRYGRPINTIDDAQAVFVQRAVKKIIGHRGMVQDIHVTTDEPRTKHQNAHRIMVVTACERGRYRDTPLEGGRSASIEFMIMERERFPWEQYDDE